MSSKLTKSKIESIKEYLSKDIDVFVTAKKHNVSSGTVYKIKNNRYAVKEATEKKIKEYTTVSSLISLFKSSRSKTIEILEYIIKNKRVTIYTDCYSNKFKSFEVEYLTKYINIFYFRNIKNNRIMCFKFGDFLAQNVKVIK